MAIALVANVRNAQAVAGNTSSAIDTTGATLLVCHVSSYSLGDTPSVSDSKSNTWTALTSQTDGGSRSQLFYAANPTVGTGHTFTISGTTLFHTTCWAAFSGVKVSSPFDQQNGGHQNSGTSLAVGSITPPEDNELFISGLSLDTGSSGTDSIDLSFSITDQAAFAGGTAIGGALAYLVETSAAAKSPTWSWTGNAPNAGTIATFKAQAGTAISASTGVETWSGLTASIVAPTVVTATRGTETWNGLTASINARTQINATTGVETWNGLTASINARTNVQATVGVETWSGLGANVVIAGALNIQATTGTEIWGSPGAASITGGGIVPGGGGLHPFRIFRAGKAKRGPIYRG